MLRLRAELMKYSSISLKKHQKEVKMREEPKRRIIVHIDKAKLNTASGIRFTRETKTHLEFNIPVELVEPNGDWIRAELVEFLKASSEQENENDRNPSY